MKYREHVIKLIKNFKTFEIQRIPREENTKADAACKLASLTFPHVTSHVLVEILKKKSIEMEEVNSIVEEVESNWMTPLVRYLQNGEVPADPKEAR